MIKKIRVFAKEVTSKDGNKFITFSYVSKKTGEFLTVKFTKDCLTSPKKSGYYLIDFDTENANIKKGKKHEEFTENDTLWIKQVDGCVLDTDYIKELEEKKINRFTELFDEDI